MTVVLGIAVAVGIAVVVASQTGALRGPTAKRLTRVVVGFVAIYVLFIAFYWYMGESNGGCC